MIDVERIIADLEALKRHPDMFVNPVTPEMLASYLSGLQRGVFLLQKTFTFHDFVEAHRFAMKSKGMVLTAVTPYRELREKDVDETEIIRQMIDIESAMWRILSQESQ